MEDLAGSIPTAEVAIAIAVPPTTEATLIKTAAERLAEATSLLDTGLISQEMFDWWYTNVLQKNVLPTMRRK